MEIEELEGVSSQYLADDYMVKVTFTWDHKDKSGKLVTMEGDFWLITDEGMSYAAKLRGRNASLSRDFVELNLFMLTERIRFGERGSESLPLKKARELVERPNPMIEAMVDAAYAKLKQLREEGAPKSQAVKH